MTRWSARQGAGQEGFNAKHVATSALWAVTQRVAGQQLVAVTVVERNIRNLDHGCGFGVSSGCNLIQATRVRQLIAQVTDFT